MCRYSDANYRTHFVCLGCKWHAKDDRSGTPPLCPTCRNEMVDMGRDFKAPRKEASNQWTKLRILVAQGVRFDSCGCDGPGPRPKTLGEARNPLLR